MSNGSVLLTDICDFISQKVSPLKIDKESYISTENMLSDLGGVVSPANVPSTGKVNNYQKGDVLFSNIRTYFRKVWLADKDGGCSNDIIVFRPKENVSSEYLFSVIADNSFIEYTVKTSKGTKMPRGDKDAIKQYRLPNLDSNQRNSIGTILQKYNDRIELNRKMNQTLEEMAQALFKSWFVDFDPVLDNAILAGNEIPESLNVKKEKRLKVQEKHGLKVDERFPDRFLCNEELGKWIPEGWEVKKLGEKFEVTMGQSPPGSSYNEVGVGKPFFQGKTDFGFRFPKKRMFCTEPKRVANKNDTLISVRAPVGSTNLALEDCIIGRGLCAIRHNSNAISFTYYTALELKSIFDVFEGDGTVFGSINQKSLKEINLITSSQNLILEFERISNKIDNKIEVNSNQIETLTQLRDSLLPRLISGEIGVEEEMVN